MNEKSDLNDYKQFIDFQKQVLEPSINNYVAVDNRLTKELVKGKEKLTQEAIRLNEEQKGFEMLQEQTFNEKREVQKQNDLLNLELVKSQEKESNLMDELNTMTSLLTKSQEKIFQMETNPKSPKGSKEPTGDSASLVEIEELPKRKPSEEELQAKKDKKEALRLGREQMEEKKQVKEINDKKNTDILINMINNNKSYGETIIKAVKELFGNDTHELLVKYGQKAGSAKARKTAMKQLLMEKRGVKFEN